MITLSENIKKFKYLNNLYRIDCVELIKMIDWLKIYSPSIYGTKSSQNTISFRIWDEKNFYYFDEIKGLNLFIIRKLNEYLSLRIKIDKEIEICLQNFQNSLQGYDEDVLKFEPMDEDFRERFELDRINISRPYNELKKLKNEIDADWLIISSIKKQIKEREIMAKKYLNYKLEDLKEDLERFIDPSDDLILNA